MRRAVTTAIASITAGALIAERGLRHWGSRADERAAELPGDELLPGAQAVATRAITIAGRPEDVWPWIAQLGQDRGGFYSYTWIESLVGANVTNADRIVPEWQVREVGDVVLGEPRRRVAWRVTHLDPPRGMALLGVEASDDAAEHRPPPYEFAWSFNLRPDPTGRTRLIVRETWRHQAGAASWLLVRGLLLVSGVMTRAMLRGVRRRVEAPH